MNADLLATWESLGSSQQRLWLAIGQTLLNEQGKDGAPSGEAAKEAPREARFASSLQEAVLRLQAVAGWLIRGKGCGLSAQEILAAAIGVDPRTGVQVWGPLDRDDDDRCVLALNRFPWAAFGLDILAERFPDQWRVAAERIRKRLPSHEPNVVDPGAET